MVNLNECKLGDKLKMRNGELAIYVGKTSWSVPAIVACIRPEAR